MNPALKAVTAKAITVVAGGVTLGMVLAWHANPVPKPRPAANWERLFQHQDIAMDPPQLWIEAPPTDVVADWQDSYRPDLDYDTVVTGWAGPPLPEWSEEADPVYGDPFPPATASVAETVPPRIEQAADAAEEAAADAQAAALPLPR